MATKLGETTLTRAATGSVRGTRRQGTTNHNELNPEVPLWNGESALGVVHLEIATSYTDASPLVSLDAKIMHVRTPVGGDSMDVNISVEAHGSYSVNGGAAVDLTTQVLQTGLWTEEDGLIYAFDQLWYEVSASVGLTLSGTFEVWGELEPGFSGASKYIYSGYIDDQSPFSDSKNYRVYYKLKPGTSLTATFTLGADTDTVSIDAETLGITAEELDAMLRGGLGPVEAEAHGARVSDVRGSAWDEVIRVGSTIPSCADITLTSPCSGVSHSGNLYYDDDPATRSYATLCGNALSVYDIGQVTPYNYVLFRPICGAYTDSHSGTIEHIDGTGHSGLHIATSEGNATTAADGSWTVSKSYAGWYVFSWLNAYDAYRNTPHEVQDINDVTATGWRQYRAEITDPEVYFPGLADLATYPSYAYFDDSRLEHICPQSVSSALTVTAAASKTAYTFGLSGWTATGGTLTAAGGGVEFAATGAGQLSRDFTGTQLWGWRKLRLYCSSTDTSTALTLTINGREYQFKCPGSGYAEIDVLRVNNAAYSGGVENQLYGSANPDYSNGIGDMGTVTITGFAAGQTYTFNRIEAHRLAEGSGGYVKCVIDPVFVGSAIGDSRETDGVAMYTTGGANGERISKLGYVIVDDLVACELFDMKHYKYAGIGAGGADVWTHTPLTLGDSLTRFPQSQDVLTFTAPDTTLLATYLQRGTRSGYGSISLNWEVRAAKLICPYDYMDPPHEYYKLSRGGCLLRVVNKSGSSTAGLTFTLKTRLYDGDSGTTETYTLNNYGACWIPAHRMPTTVRGQVVSLNGDGTWTCELPTGEFTGSRLYYVDAATHEPLFLSISAQSGGVLTFATPPTTKLPGVGDYVYIERAYVYDILISSGGTTYTQTLAFRNHTYAYATICAGLGVHGWLYDPASDHICYVPGGGDHMEYL